jgi:hypothetical protein
LVFAQVRAPVAQPCVRGPPQAEEAGCREDSLAYFSIEMLNISLRLQEKEAFAVNDTAGKICRILEERFTGMFRNRFAAGVAEADEFLPVVGL